MMSIFNHIFIFLNEFYLLFKILCQDPAKSRDPDPKQNFFFKIPKLTCITPNMGA
jgi:hypothetical protein